IMLEAWYALALVVCSINRLRRGGRAKRKASASFTAQQKFKVGGDQERFLGGVLSRLKKRGWKVQRGDDGATLATKGGWAWWASTALHLGVVFFLIAGSVKLIAGVKEDITLFEGQSIMLPISLGTELELTAVDFETVIDPNSGKVLNYYTDLELNGQGAPPTAYVEVNYPFKYDGISIYQWFTDEGQSLRLIFAPEEELNRYIEELSNYQSSQIYPESVRVSLNITDGEATRLNGPLSIPITEDATPFPDTAYSMVIRSYFTNHSIGAGGDLNSNPMANPAARIDFYDDGELIAENALVYALYPDFNPSALTELGVSISLGEARFTHDTVPELPTSALSIPTSPESRLRLPDGRIAQRSISDHNDLIVFIEENGEEIHLHEGETGLLNDATAITWLGGEVEPLTGLMAKRDPGLLIFWIGAILVIVGSFLVFAVPQRSLRLRIEGKEVAIASKGLSGKEVRRYLSPNELQN
ncbi:cytochrome c biogenesis protein ResB, partial [bacterium]|nr:cytochrome c biogenesis protein ResB [bacterium]